MKDRRFNGSMVDFKLFKFHYHKTDYKAEILYYWIKYLTQIINFIDIITSAVLYKQGKAEVFFHTVIIWAK